MIHIAFSDIDEKELSNKIYAIALSALAAAGACHRSDGLPLTGPNIQEMLKW